MKARSCHRHRVLMVAGCMIPTVTAQMQREIHTDDITDINKNIIQITQWLTTRVCTQQLKELSSLPEAEKLCYAKP